MEDVVEGVGKKGTSRRSTLGGNRLPPAKPLYDDRIKRSSFFLQSPVVRKTFAHHSKQSGVSIRSADQIDLLGITRDPSPEATEWLETAKSRLEYLRHSKALDTDLVESVVRRGRESLASAAGSDRSTRSRKDGAPKGAKAPPKGAKGAIGGIRGKPMKSPGLRRKSIELSSKVERRRSQTQSERRRSVRRLSNTITDTKLAASSGSEVFSARKNDGGVLPNLNRRKSRGNVVHIQYPPATEGEPIYTYANGKAEPAPPPTSAGKQRWKIEQPRILSKLALANLGDTMDSQSSRLAPPDSAKPRASGAPSRSPTAGSHVRPLSGVPFKPRDKPPPKPPQKASKERSPQKKPPAAPSEQVKAAVKLIRTIMYSGGPPRFKDECRVFDMLIFSNLSAAAEVEKNLKRINKVTNKDTAYSSDEPLTWYSSLTKWPRCSAPPCAACAFHGGLYGYGCVMRSEPSKVRSCTGRFASLGPRPAHDAPRFVQQAAKVKRLSSAATAFATTSSKNRLKAIITLVVAVLRWRKLAQPASEGEGTETEKSEVTDHAAEARQVSAITKKLKDIKIKQSRPSCVARLEELIDAAKVVLKHHATGFEMQRALDDAFLPPEQKRPASGRRARSARLRTHKESVFMLPATNTSTRLEATRESEHVEPWILSCDAACLAIPGLRKLARECAPSDIVAAVVQEDLTRKKAAELASSDKEEEAGLNFSIETGGETGGWAQSLWDNLDSVDGAQQTLVDWSRARTAMKFCAERWPKQLQQVPSDILSTNYAGRGGVRPFLRFHNNTGCILWPSGRVAIAVSNTEAGKYLWIFDDKPCPSTLFSMSPFGHGTVNWPSGRARVVFSPVGGGVYQDDGQCTAEWDTASIPGPHKLGLGKGLEITIHSEVWVSVYFRLSGQKYDLTVGPVNESALSRRPRSKRPKLAHDQILQAAMQKFQSLADAYLRLLTSAETHAQASVKELCAYERATDTRPPDGFVEKNAMHYGDNIAVAPPSRQRTPRPKTPRDDWRRASTPNSMWGVSRATTAQRNETEPLDVPLNSATTLHSPSDQDS